MPSSYIVAARRRVCRYVESTSRAGISIIDVRLKLNHDSTAALAEITARLQQVRAEIPQEALPPIVEVQRAVFFRVHEQNPPLADYPAHVERVVALRNDRAHGRIGLRACV